MDSELVATDLLVTSGKREAIDLLCRLLEFYADIRDIL